MVDDNAANLKLLSYLLSARGYEVRVAESAEAALSVMETFLPRLILMDIQLPGMDGLALTRKLRATPATSDVTIIAVTAYAMTGDERKALDAGCDGYITKPINTRSLPATVAEHLGRSRGDEDNR